MALATLCAKIAKEKRSYVQPRFRTFIVDHGVRPGSNAEAKAVASLMEALGTLENLYLPS